MSGNRCEFYSGTRRLDRKPTAAKAICHGCAGAWCHQSSPSLGEPAVLPIPEKVEQDLDVSPGSIIGRHTNADIRPDMLTSAEGHLHFWYNIPISLGSSLEIVIRDELHHGRPLTSEPMGLIEFLADRVSPEKASRRLRCIRWQFASNLNLKECLGRK